MPKAVAMYPRVLFWQVAGNLAQTGLSQVSYSITNTPRVPASNTAGSRGPDSVIRSRLWPPLGSALPSSALFSPWGIPSLALLGGKINPGFPSYTFTAFSEEKIIASLATIPRVHLFGCVLGNVSIVTLRITIPEQTGGPQYLLSVGEGQSSRGKLMRLLPQEGGVDTEWTKMTMVTPSASKWLSRLSAQVSCCLACPFGRVTVPKTQRCLPGPHTWFWHLAQDAPGREEDSPGTEIWPCSPQFLLWLTKWGQVALIWAETQGDRGQEGPASRIGK